MAAEQFAAWRISSIASIRAHEAKGCVAWRMVAFMAPGIMLGAFLTSRHEVHINPTYIAIFFAVFMALIAAQMFLNLRPKSSTNPATQCTAFIIGAGKPKTATSCPLPVQSTIHDNTLGKACRRSIPPYV